MNDDRNVPNRPNLNHNQVILQSKLRVSQSGVEMLDFTIPLGIMELHCSCPIPDEGTDGSPVYVHMRPARLPRDSARGPRDFAPRGPRDSRGPRPDTRNDGGNGGDRDENWGNRGSYGS